MRFQGGKSYPGQGKKVELASTIEIDRFESVAPEFFERILDMDYNDCLITDESSLWDFHTERSNEPFYSKILEVYGINVSDVESGNLARIFQRIVEAKHPRE